jgi:hypothetical protein
MDNVGRDALIETRNVLKDLSNFLINVQQKHPSAAHPTLDHMSIRLSDLALEIESFSRQSVAAVVQN